MRALRAECPTLHVVLAETASRHGGYSSAGRARLVVADVAGSSPVTHPSQSEPPTWSRSGARPASGTSPTPQAARAQHQQHAVSRCAASARSGRTAHETSGARRATAAAAHRRAGWGPSTPRPSSRDRSHASSARARSSAASPKPADRLTATAQRREPTVGALRPTGARALPRHAHVDDGLGGGVTEQVDPGLARRQRLGERRPRRPRREVLDLGVRLQQVGVPHPLADPVVHGADPARHHRHRRRHRRRARAGQPARAARDGSRSGTRDRPSGFASATATIASTMLRRLMISAP